MRCKMYECGGAAESEMKFVIPGGVEGMVGVCKKCFDRITHETRISLAFDIKEKELELSYVSIVSARPND